jgi:hypothetical protein
MDFVTEIQKCAVITNRVLQDGNKNGHHNRHFSREIRIVNA